jgi:hypothetical protein
MEERSAIENRGLRQDRGRAKFGEAGTPRIRHGHAYCSGPGFNPFSAPGGAWTHVNAASVRLNKVPGRDNKLALTRRSAKSWAVVALPLEIAWQAPA